MSFEIEQRAIQEEIAPTTEHSLQLARMGPNPLSSLIPLIPTSCIAAWSLVAGLLSEDWRATHYVLILESLFATWMLYGVFMKGAKTDTEREKKDTIMDLPL
ncbi:uncharacterized protein LY89DRAFT_737449 [Mollisia scopiformis]|uniref:Uncharacterized protein n=1 Tax=Mollisia scopiformis TaxID=149040 RepID=A0A194X0I5_MOLSC|nr:uncharacterized protein LY89DRAFT_737449 [Mollisia scopiformis]KUJ13469.1 hypothetical protein LY89DRAFT_737449 [Mollisia scopiformis]